MAWLDDVRSLIGAAANAGAGAVETVVNDVGEAIANFAETAGNGLQGGLKSVGSSPPLAWLGSVVGGITSLVGAAIKGTSGLISGLPAGIIRILGGLLSLNRSLVLKGLIDIGSSISGSLIIIAGTFWSLVQRIILLQNHDRSLTKEEKARLALVFRNSLSLESIRLIQGRSGAFGITTDGAFTLGNTIFLNKTDLATEPDILVHECVHVWQYQNLGPRYAIDALGAQAIYGRTGRSGDAYDWKAELTRGNSRWKDFNKEAQAQLVQEVWSRGTAIDPDLNLLGAGEGIFYEAENDLNKGQFVDFDGTDFTELANEAVGVLRRTINKKAARRF